MKRPDLEWDKFVDTFFDEYFLLYPSQGTSAGFHRYDSELEDYSQHGIENEIQFVENCLLRLEKFEAKPLSLERRQDCQLVVLHLKSTLLELETIQSWKKNPDHYSAGIAQSAFDLISREFASPEQRLQALIQRERRMPAVLEAGKKNLDRSPRIYTEVAIEQLPGIIDFFQKEVPGAFQEVDDHRLLTEFRRTNADVVAALQDFDGFLKGVLLPRSTGDFRIGVDNYQKKLLYGEMINTPLDRLLQIGYEDLHRNQQQFRKIAGQIDPNKSLQELLADLQKDHPEPECLLQRFRQDVTDIRQYILDEQIVTIPSDTLPVVKETPPFARALTFASMDTPGPYENAATEAFFNVTLPEDGWSETDIESFMGQYNRGTITSTAIHEVYPGHYVQFLWLRAAGSKVRKLLGCDSNAEGWAHYCEQMMLDEGYGNDDPQLRLGQLQDALLRDARYIVGISMHTGTMTFEEAVQFFEKEGYLSRSVAEVEAKRGTLDPTYLVYTLGKLEILKLRDDYRKKMGSKFSLKQFHDTFLQQGLAPIAMVRETMLSDYHPAV